MTVPSPSPVQATAPTEFRETPFTASEIDASCRLTVLFLFSCAAGWLALGAIFSVISGIKVHAPGFLADWAWLTYGRVRPASADMLIYGFVLQASLGTALWLICRLGRSLLAGSWTIVAAAVLWNLAVLVGVVQVFGGGSTSFAWLEFPRTAPLALFCSYLIIGGLALANLHARTERRMYVSQWFLLAAIVWFPWIYSTAEMLLVYSPVRGVMQVVVSGWYGHNFFEVCLSGFGLAILFYFMPKVLGRDLYSHELAMFGFWLLVFIGSWGGLRHGLPVPNWLSGISGVASVFRVVPLLALAISWFWTVNHAKTSLSRDPVGQFILLAAVSFFLEEALRIVASTPAVNRLTLFTLFGEGVTQLRLHGFLSMALLGAMYYIVPRLAGVSWPSPRLVRLQFWCCIVGVALLFLPLLSAGIDQGLEINDPKKPFLEISRHMLPFLGTSTLGMTLLGLGYLVFVGHLGRLLATVCPCCTAPVGAWLTRPAVPTTGGVKG